MAAPCSSAGVYLPRRRKSIWKAIRLRSAPVRHECKSSHQADGISPSGSERRTVVEDPEGRSVALTGNLAETSFTDLIQFYSISRQTAAVRIVSPAGPEHDGILYIEGGDVVDARFGELNGVEAVRRALRLKEGEFRVELNVKCDERTIFEPWSKLVLEEMCAEDEALNVESARAGEFGLDLEDKLGLEDRLGLEDTLEEKEQIAMPATEATEGPRYCPVCNRKYLRGTTCSDDGAQLIRGSPPGRSTPTPHNLPRTMSRPEMKLEWKVPRWSNTLERNRARSYLTSRSTHRSAGTIHHRAGD